MGRQEKLLADILSGRKDYNIPFDALCGLLESLGFSRRVNGSHFIYSKRGVGRLITLQRDGSKAKGYQVAQIRALFEEYGLGVADNE